MTIIPYFPIAIAIIVAIRVKRFINQFRNTGTTTPQTAKTLEELNLKRWVLFYRLLKQNVIIEIGTERYYLHEENLAEYSRTKRKTVLLFVAALILIMFLFAIASEFIFI